MWFYKYAAPTALPAPDSGSTLREAPAARQENNSTEANEGNEDEFSLRFLCCLLLKRNPCHPYHCKKKSRNSNKNSAAKERKELRDKHLRCSSLCDLCDLLWPIQFWLRLCRSGRSVVQSLWLRLALLGSFVANSVLVAACRAVLHSVRVTDFREDFTTDGPERQSRNQN